MLFKEKLSEAKEWYNAKYTEVNDRVKVNVAMLIK